MNRQSEGGDATIREEAIARVRHHRAQGALSRHPGQWTNVGMTVPMMDALIAMHEQVEQNEAALESESALQRESEEERARMDYLRGLFTEDANGDWTINVTIRGVDGDLTDALNAAIRTAMPQAAVYHTGHIPELNFALTPLPETPEP